MNPLLRLGILGGLCSALAGPAAATSMLMIDVGGQGATGSVPVGEAVAITVTAEDIPSAGGGLFGFGFRLGFDPDGLELLSLSIGPLWTGLSATDIASNQAGATANRLGETSGPSGSGVLLATLELRVVESGIYPLSLFAFTGPGDNVLFDNTVLDQDPGTFFVGGTLVPEPVSLLPLLGLLAGLKRTRTAA